MKKPEAITEIMKHQPTDQESRLTSYADKKQTTPKTQHLYKLMIDLFGSKWEREHGLEGGDKFYVWADKIEDMPKNELRLRFDAMAFKFKSDVSQGKDIWPPSVAYFMALNGNPRVGEDAYNFKAIKSMRRLREHTVDEYADMAETGAKRLKENDNKNLTVEEQLAKLK